MRAYQECLEKHGTNTAQILLTAGDFDSRGRYLNVRNTILTLFEWDVLPIINENDTVSVAEIKFGDNDHLAAMVTNLLQAPLLILLTVVDGLFAADPNTDPSAKKIDTVPLDRRLDHGHGRRRSQHAGHRRHAQQTQGRAPGDRCRRIGHHGQRRESRHSRRHLCRRTGRHVVSAARLDNSGLETLAGFHGTAQGQVVRRCRSVHRRPKKGRSLLPIGVVQVQGTFKKGDVVALCDTEGIEFARGLTNYASADADRILGLRTEQITAVLGTLPYEEIVHSDNLVIVI